MSRGLGVVEFLRFINFKYVRSPCNHAMIVHKESQPMYFPSESAVTMTKLDMLQWSPLKAAAESCEWTKSIDLSDHGTIQSLPIRRDILSSPSLSAAVNHQGCYPNHPALKETTGLLLYFPPQQHVRFSHCNGATMGQHTGCLALCTSSHKCR